MNVASLDLCRELYGLSGGFEGRWYDTADYWEEAAADGAPLPKYDLGYLLRKLPQMIGNNYALYLYRRQDEDYWIATYGGNRSIKGIPSCRSRYSPENAICKLAIELIKQKILTP